MQEIGPLTRSMRLAARPITPQCINRNLHYISVARAIDAKGGENLLDSLHLCITKLVAELDAVALLDAIRHVV